MTAHCWNLYTRWRPHQRIKECPSPHPHSKYLVLILLQARAYFLAGVWTLPLRKCPVESVASWSQAESNEKHVVRDPITHLMSTPESTSTHLLYHGQPYARVDLNPMSESTLSPQSGTLDLALVSRWSAEHPPRDVSNIETYMGWHFKKRGLCKFPPLLGINKGDK
jgi:hypothetical protein